MSEDLDANSAGQEPGSAEVGGVTDEANVESNPLGGDAEDSVLGDTEENFLLWPTCSHLLDRGVRTHCHTFSVSAC